MPSREKTQADFDLERFIDMFDEAITSKDERVVNALRSLMMMVILTKSETHSQSDRDNGPLRQLYDDLHNLNRRITSTEESIRRIEDHHRREYETKTYRVNDYDSYRWTGRGLQDFWDNNFDSTTLKRINSPTPISQQPLTKGNKNGK